MFNLVTVVYPIIEYYYGYTHQSLTRQLVSLSKQSPHEKDIEFCQQVVTELNIDVEINPIRTDVMTGMIHDVDKKKVIYLSPTEVFEDNEPLNRFLLRHELHHYLTDHPKNTYIWPNLFGLCTVLLPLPPLWKMCLSIVLNRSLYIFLYIRSEQQADNFAIQHSSIKELEEGYRYFTTFKKLISEHYSGLNFWNKIKYHYNSWMTTPHPDTGKRALRILIEIEEREK